MDRSLATEGTPRIAFSTLGCRLNLAETDALATRFREAGYEIVDFTAPADVYVINSCTVTNRADRKSRNQWYRALRMAGAGEPDTAPANSTPLVVLTGCFVDGHRDDLESDGRTLVVANENKHALFDLVEAERRGEIAAPSGSVFDFPVPSRLFHTRTMIKVQDGCDNFCTFCIIPFVRGRAISRPATEVVAAAREAVSAGSRELVLTGVNMSRYRDGETRFSTLVRMLLDLAGDFRLRISSMEPDELDATFIELFEHPKMCPHVHLCLQSGSDRVLTAMRRQYSYNDFRDVAKALKARRPDFNLTTDIIVGFPGETNEEFEQTLTSIRELEFGHVHTFPYSEREGTRAVKLPGRTPERIRTERAARVREVAAETKRFYRSRLVGGTQHVLVENTRPAGDGLLLARGYGEHYVPVRLTTPATAADLENAIVPVLITGLEETGDDPALTGRPAPA